MLTKNFFERTSIDSGKVDTYTRIVIFAYDQNM